MLLGQFDEDSKSNSDALAFDVAETTNLSPTAFPLKICKMKTKFSSESKIKYLMT